MISLTPLLDLIDAAYDAPNDIYFGLKDGILAFRGTEDMADWMVDASVLRTDYTLQTEELSIPAGRVHTGFLRRWEAIRPLVFEALGPKPYPLTVTGHSLGGAMAALCAIELDARKWPLRVFTFGAPRIGNSDFVKFLNQNLRDYTRVENWGDPVPWVPTYTRGWRHAGTSLAVGNPLNLLKWPHTQHHGRDAYRKAVS